jgi:hypothetical protein
MPKVITMSNYSATIVRISNVSNHPNADRLNLTNIHGNIVIIGKDIKVGDLGVYFPLESQLSEEFAKANDLIRRKDEDGKPAGGMLADNRRIRAIKLRGIPSMGLWMPVSSLERMVQFVRPDQSYKFKEGDINEGEETDGYFGISLCKKYIPRQSQTNGLGKRHKEGQKPHERKIIENQFRFHFDTAQLGKNVHRINPTDLIAVTWKLHGTSAIVGNVLVKRKLSWLEKLAVKLRVNVSTTEYDYIYASRRVVKNTDFNNHYYSEDLWTRVGRENFFGKLHPGEQVYYEIVGYTGDGGYIQKGFDYKCEPGTNKIYVYRITQTAADGSVVELQWNQVKDRCIELGVPSVPQEFYGLACDVFPWLRREDNWNENFLTELRRGFVFDQDSIFCNNSVPEEGVCVRKEGLNIEVYKLKAFRFLEFETKQLDEGTVDLETEQTSAE